MFKRVLKYRWFFFIYIFLSIWVGGVTSYALGNNISSSFNGTIRYVREGGRGTQDGSSWANASGDLQGMIDASIRGDRVYVAGGTYYAVTAGEVKDERELSHERQRAFIMKAGVDVYGGFNPQMPEVTPEDRQRKTGAQYGWQWKYASVLSGAQLEQGIADRWELDSIGWKWRPIGYIDNVTHVVWFASDGFAEPPLDGEVSAANALRWETVLDGFTIEGGYADGVEIDVKGSSARFGGGIYLVENGIVRNCIVQKNFAATRGGGIFMNNGGTVSDSYITCNSSPGYNQVRNGFGGGVYISRKGKLERSFVVNNCARMGGGVFLAKDKNALPYEAVVEMSIIANNTAAQEGGGVYGQMAGVMTGTLVLNNNCMDAGLAGHGKTGGVFCDGYLVITGSAVYGNAAAANSHQGYAINIVPEDESASIPASLQIVYSGIEHISEEIFGSASLTGVVSIDDENPIYRPLFVQPIRTTGIIPTAQLAEQYLSIANWDKESCSVFMFRGATEGEAPYLCVPQNIRVNIPIKTIDGKIIDRRPDIGPYLGDMPVINHGYVGAVPVVFVDNESKVCGDGSSWEQPARLLVPAIDHLAEIGGGEVWVKEGDFMPSFAAPGVSPQAFTITMRSNVKVYGGFPRAIPAPVMEDRDPVAYRTILNGNIGLAKEISDNSYHIVQFGEDIVKEAVLDGFNIRNANSLSDRWNVEQGGAVIVKSPHAVLRNCIIENSLAAEGAAVLATQDFRMENCVVNNNEAQAGAVLKVTAGSELVNLTVVMNKGNGIEGGKVTNTLIWGNTGEQAVGCILDHSAMPGIVEENGNVSLDSTVKNGLQHLTNPTRVQGIITQGYGTAFGGPALFEPTCLAKTIIAGTEVNAPLTDIRGIQRGRGGQFDIGAFESTCMPEEGNIRYVRENGTGDGKSWKNASEDLQAMVDQLMGSGGEVWVAAGTYTHTFIMREGVHVYGGFPAYGTPGMKQREPRSEAPEYRTILQAQATMQEGDNKRVLTQEKAFTQWTAWDGFTIQNGALQKNNARDGGAGAKLYANGWLINCVIQNNQNTVSSGNNVENVKGGGVYCDGGGLVNCYLVGNKLAATSSKFWGGICKTFGAGLYMESGTVYNCVITDNTASASTSIIGGNACAYGAGVYVGNGNFYNNTIVYNQATSESGFGGSEESASGLRVAGSASITNCIVWGNQGTTAQITKESGATAIVHYSCIENGYSGIGNINIDPAFTSNTDFHLQETSPCINTGNTYPDGIDLPDEDMDYSERIKDCAVDMGAYEFGNLLEGTIYPYISGDTARVYVTLYGKGKADGSSWEAAACHTKLQRAIHVLSLRKEAVRQVWVATGKLKNTDTDLYVADFYPTQQLDSEEVRSRTFVMKAGVSVIGGFQGNEHTLEERVFNVNRAVTVMNGDIFKTPENTDDDAFHVVTFDTLKAGEAAVLENMVVRNGNASHYDKEEFQHGGGIVIVPGGIVRNCYIQDCQAIRQGGGVFIKDKPEGWKGRSAVLVGCVVTGNKAATGGGIYAGIRALMTANTVVKNQAETGGGLAFTWPVAVQNCVLWNNTGNNGKDIYGVTDVPYDHGTGEALLPEKIYPINFSAVEGQHIAGNYNISLSAENEGQGFSPCFIDPENATLKNGGWGLKPASSLIDRGINNNVFDYTAPEVLLQSYSLSSKDIAGKARIYTYFSSNNGAYMDIGAYELNASIELRPDTHNRLYVTHQARGKMDGSSWQNATCNLQAALNYFQEKRLKGEVWVQGGYSYVPSTPISKEEKDGRASSFILNAYADLYGGFMGDTITDVNTERIAENSLEERPRFDRNKNGIYEEYEFRYETILDGGINPVEGYDRNAYHVLFYENNENTEAIILDGFTVQNGQAVCVTAGTRHDSGGALYATGKMNVRNCIFQYNYAKLNGGAIYMAGGGTVEGSLLGSNGVLEGSGGAIYIQGGTVANSIVVNNTSLGISAGGICCVLGKVFNTIIARNNNQRQGAGIHLTQSVMVNTVVWGNAKQTPGISEVAGTGEIKFCAVPKDRTESILPVHSVYLNSSNDAPDGPHFLNPSSEAVTEAYSWASNWRVPLLSPLRDAGDSISYKAEGLPLLVNYIQYAGEKEITAVSRIQGHNIDIGYYEGAAVKLADQDTLYVRTWEDPTVVADGSSWKQATSDLQAAIEKLESRKSGNNKQVWVAQGTYVPTKFRGTETTSRSFVIDGGGIGIYGGFPDDLEGALAPTMNDRNPARYPTVLDGSSVKSTHLVFGNKAKDLTLLDGFVLRGGSATGTGTDGKGAAVYVTDSAYALQLSRCVVAENQAVGTGGAIYAESRIYIANSLICKNKTVGLRTSYVQMVNNTFVQNSEGGAVIDDQGTAWGGIQNCIFWGNGANQLVKGNTPVVYCAVQDSLLTGVGNIRLSAENEAETGPRFVNPADSTIMGWALDCGSPLAETGSDAYPAGMVWAAQDLLGRDRILFQHIDIGALESVKGKAPEKPMLGLGKIVTCQNIKKEVLVHNEIPDTKLYAIYEGWKMLLTDKLVINGDKPGLHVYEIVRVDTTGCSSPADSVWAQVEEARVPTDFTGISEVCEGEPVVLTYRSLPGYVYKLFDGGMPLLPESYEVRENMVTVLLPEKGVHHYALQAFHGECASEFTPTLEVNVYPSGVAPEGMLLEALDGKDRDVCEGEAITNIVYRYQGADGVEVSNLIGVSGVLDKVNQLFTISGVPTSSFVYTVRTTGVNACATVHVRGMIKMNPKPEFNLGN